MDALAEQPGLDHRARIERRVLKALAQHGCARASQPVLRLAGPTASAAGAPAAAASKGSTAPSRPTRSASAWSPVRPGVRRCRGSARPSSLGARHQSHSHEVALERAVALVAVEIADARTSAAPGRSIVDLDARRRARSATSGAGRRRRARSVRRVSARGMHADHAAQPARHRRRHLVDRRSSAQSPSQCSALGPIADGSRCALQRGAAALGHRPAPGPAVERDVEAQCCSGSRRAAAARPGVDTARTRCR